MSDNYSLIIKNGSCYIEGKFQNTDVALSGSKIKKIGKISLNNAKVIDASGKIVLPGVIDTQVHFREPGANDAENLESGSRAAVAGGVTSVFEMPNTNPPTSNQTEFKNPICPIYQNYNAKPETNKDSIKRNLLLQLTNPVLWTQSINRMIKDGHNNFFELGPGNTLQGLIRKINSEVTTEKLEI